MKKFILTFFTAFIFIPLLFSQDVHFSQPYSSPLNLNPAFAGSSGCARTVAGYRRQPWRPTYGTFFASYDQYLKPLRGGVGLNYYNDWVGEWFNTNRVDVVYSAHIPFFKGRYVFKPAAEISFVSKRENAYSINWGGTASPQATPYTIRNNFLDLSFGGLLYSKRVFLGTVFHHVTEPHDGFISESPLPMKFTVHFGGNLGNVDAEKAFVITPSLLFSHQEDFREFIMNCKVRYDKFSLGIGYRNADALILSAGFQYVRIKIGYSYDLIISRLGMATAGSHEFVLGFAFNCKDSAEEKLFLHNTPF